MDDFENQLLLRGKKHRRKDSIEEVFPYYAVVLLCAVVLGLVGALLSGWL